LQNYGYFDGFINYPPYFTPGILPAQYACRLGQICNYTLPTPLDKENNAV